MACTCGGIISNVLYPCDTEGELIGEGNSESAHKEVTERIINYIQTIESGKAEEWRKKHYGESAIATTVHQEVISDILQEELTKYEKSVAECEKCGRLWIQIEQYKNEYLAYFPDNGRYNAVCKKFKKKNA